MDLQALYREMLQCQACKLRAACTQVVPAEGCTESPLLLVVGEAPGADEDMEGRPFVGRAGQLLREVIRETGILNKRNTLISNVVMCRPPKNKFPTDKSPKICATKWLFQEIEMARPQRMLLLGSKALWHVAGMKGITENRGQWYNIRGVRTMATFHPSYILRCESEGKVQVRREFEDDIMEVAEEIKSINVPR